MKYKKINMSKEEYISNIGLKIKTLRESKGITQERLAFESDTSLRTLRNVEQGTNDIKLSTLCKIANGLNIKIEKLL